jgi:uncharacterized membrane protein required for colicin V production
MLLWLHALQTPTPIGLELAPADWVGLGLLGVFAALGAWWGLWWQFFRAVSLALALGIASAFTPALARRLIDLWPGLPPTACEALSFLVLFVAAALLLGQLGRLGARALAGLKLGLLDRVAGLLAGALSALLLYAMLVATARRFGPEAWAEETFNGTRSARLADDFEHLYERTHRSWPAWRRWVAERLRAAEEGLTAPPLPSPDEAPPKHSAAGSTPGAVR